MRSKFKWIFTLLVAFTMQFSFAQQKTVTGTVTSDGAALPGATVSISGTQQGTQTDENGKFSIKAAQGDVLEISFLDKETKIVTIGAGNVVNVVLASKANVIDVVTIEGAVGVKRKKAAVTSSYSTVTADEIKAASNPDPVRAIIGKVSGVTINATTNGVNGDNSIRVRSMLSFSGSTEALVVIDGVISTASIFSSLSPEAITNVTILKGAQGAALYGSQGKSGVVLVTTKKGSSSEKMEVRLSSSVDFENINFVPLRQTKYGQGWNGTRYSDENGGWGEVFDGAPHQSGFALPDGSTIVRPYSSLGDDSIKDFYQTGVTYQNNLSVGMSGKSSYFNLNLGNYKRDFILDGDNLNRNTVLISAGKTIGKLSLGGSINYINQRVKQANVNAATSRGDYTLLTNLLQTATNVPIELFKDRGLYGWNSYYQNPYWAKENNRLAEDRNFVGINLNSKYEFNKNVNFTLNNSVQIDSRNQTSYANQATTIDDGVQTFGSFSSPASYYQSNFSSLNYYGDFMLNFDYDLTSKVGLKANLGQNFQYTSTSRLSQGGLNFDIPGWYNIQNVLNPDLPSTMNNNKVRQNITATFLNLDLNYDDYLFLNLTSRYEGNSVAALGNKFAFYPSAGVSFIPTKAFSALENKNTLSSMKLFGNVTRVGSFDAINPYDVLALGQLSSGYPYPNADGNSYLDELTYTDPNIKPEMYTTFEAGASIGFLKDRLMLDATYFNTRTTDLITRQPLSNASLYTTKLSNNGELNAKGYEIDLAYQAVKSKNFNWSGRLSYTTYKTEVVSSGASSSVILFDGGSAGADFNIGGVEGSDFPSISGTDWLRDSNGNVIVNSTTGQPLIDAKYKVLGKSTPDYILGWTNNFNYKGFGLSFTADFRTGHSFISQTKYNLTWNGHLVESADLSREDGWLLPNSVYDDPSTPGVVDYIPNTSVLTGGFYTVAGPGNRTITYWGNAASVGSENLTDATALKIREISLSYTLSEKTLKSCGLTSLKFSVNARNPFIFLADGKFIKAKNGHENRGYADPEASSNYNTSTSIAGKRAAGTMTNTSSNAVGFIGDAQYPSTKTFGFTINATF